MTRFSQVQHYNQSTNNNDPSVQLDPKEIHWPGASHHLNSLVEKKLRQEAEEREGLYSDRHDAAAAATGEADPRNETVDHEGHVEEDDVNGIATPPPQHDLEESGGNVEYRSNHVEYDLSRLHSDNQNAPTAAGAAATTAEYGQVNMADLEIGFRERMEEGLAVAKPVKDRQNNGEGDDHNDDNDDDPDDDDTAAYFPAAVEYDPDSKPYSPLHRDRYFRLYAGIACCVIVLAAVGATCAIVLSKKNAADGSPANAREQLGIREAVTKLIGSDQLQSDVAFTRALEWIIYDDPMQVTVQDSPNFFQRYIAAYFYFATTTEHPWATCNPPSAADSNYGDMAALDTTCELQLMILYDPPSYQTLPWTRWLTPLSECSWAGITCDAHQQIQKIVLNGSNMTGTFPIGIRYLPYLQEVGFGSGKLTQSIPSQLASALRHLTAIEMTANTFTGGIPTSFYNDSRTLQHLSFGMNDIKGTVPTYLGTLKDLKYLSMANNRLSGTLPSALAGANSLSRLILQNNQIKGNLPTEIGLLSSVQFLWLYGNRLTGTLPTEIGRLTQLVDLSLYFNPQLSGTLPEQLFDLTNVFRFDLYGCNFTGTISPAISNLTELNVFRISDNRFYGSVPSVLGAFTNLDAIWIHGNDFTGTMPEQVCKSRGELLQELSADCAVDPNTGKAEIDCPDTCCTVCCNADGDLCYETAKP